jgi:hypothetical protein
LEVNVNDLSKYEAYINGLSLKEKAELDKLIAKELAAKWLPDPRNQPQVTAYHSQADMMLYGGAAGSGKTSLLVGLAVTAHHRTVIFRSKAVDLRGVEEYLLELMGRDGWNGQDKILRRPECVIELGHLEKPGSERSWQGRPHDLICVGRGTPVLMADGSYKPVEQLAVGEMVQTLEGSRAIQKTFPAQFKKAVIISTATQSQVQSVEHELLTDAGWVSHGNIFSLRPFWFFEPIELPFLRKVVKWCVRPYERLLYSLSGLSFHLRHITERLLIPFQWGHASEPEICAYAGQEYLGNDFEDFDGSDQEIPQPALSIVQQELLQAVQQLADVGHNILRFVLPCDGGGVLKKLKLQGWTDRYLSGIHRYGARILAFLGLHLEQAGVQLYLHQSCDVEQPSPIDSEDDVQDKTRKHNLHIMSYVHPYTKEIRQISERSILYPSSCSVHQIGVAELYDLQVEGANHYITKGGFINKNCFDEGAQLSRAKVQFVLGWLRSVDPNQRRRVVIASNPPTGGEGEWLIEWFAPWLDPQFPNPAKSGELRWAATAPDLEGTTIWLKDASPIIFTEGREYRIANEEDAKGGNLHVIQPMTRTFIPGRLEDNPYLRDTGYRAQLQALPEPLRSQMLHGNFLAGRQDHEWQVIPSAWVKEAQARWTERPPQDAIMSAIGVDVAQGGADNSVLAPRHGPWYAPLIVEPGVKTPRPSDVAALVVRYRRNAAAVVVDVGGGYGGGVKERLEENEITVRPFNGAGESHARTADKQLPFANKRAEAHWRFREALDPDQENGSSIALPNDPQLFSDLTSIRWKLTSQGIQIESKEDLKKAERLGRSPDKGDAVIMAWSEGEKAIVANIRRKSKSNSLPTMPTIGVGSGTGWMGH